MSRKIPENIRKAAAERAGNRCEYWRLPAVDSFYGFQIDHVVSRKHGGTTMLDNPDRIVERKLLWQLGLWP